MEPRALDRVTAFTDAAVAIALTLLVLPLVDVAHEAADTSVAELLRGHQEDFLAFVLSFFVVVLFWRVHRRLLEPVVRLDETLLALNSLWLLGVVFLPVPTAMLTVEGKAERSATLLYMGNLLFVATMGLGLAGWIRRHPILHEPESAPIMRRHLHSSLIVCAVMAVVTALAVPLGTYALLLLATLPAGKAVVQRIAERRAADRTAGD
jgi:uncharacterized membrane protein